MKTSTAQLEYIREWQASHKENTRRACRKWHRANKEQENLRSREFRADNPHYMNNWKKERLKTDVQYKLGCNLRIRLSMALRGRVKTGSAIEMLGCSISELKKYLEGQFIENMDWDNYGRLGWHIDHIKPLSSFDLTDKEQLAEVCHFTNLQPLWAKDNWAKNCKINCKII